MRIISHRANIDGPNKETENHPHQIRHALSLGFDVEIDVRWNNGFWLGHDTPDYQINNEFLFNDRLWVHCKDIATFYRLQHNPVANVFYHTTDAFALTTTGLLWTYPDTQWEITDRSIAVCPERAEGWAIDKAFGVCTDFPNRYQGIRV